MWRNEIYAVFRPFGRIRRRIGSVEQAECGETRFMPFFGHSGAFGGASAQSSRRNVEKRDLCRFSAIRADSAADLLSRAGGMWRNEIYAVFRPFGRIRRGMG